MTKNKQLAINMIASVMTLAVNMLINFFLNPYIVKHIGIETYGFVALSNNLISYFALLTIALNSMSSRFISIAYFKEDYKEANQYFSSTFFSNVYISIAFLPILFFGIYNIEKFLNISPELVFDVKILMTFMAVNFIFGLLTTNLGISYYVKNQLYISSIISIIGNIIRALLLGILYIACKPYVFYIGVVALIVSMFSQIVNLHYKKILIPELKIQRSNFQFQKVKQLIFSGLWNTVTRLGNLLSEGLDLLVTNLFIGNTEMGVLAIVKIIPNLINTVLSSMIATFMPGITELYAKNQKKELVKSVKQSMKMIGMIINIPIALVIAYGDLLFSLWFPTQDAQLLQTLSIITIIPWAVMGQATIIHNVFVVLNKIKVNSILVCITGLANVFTVFILLKTTSLGLYAIAGVSTIFSIIRNLIYTVPYGAKYLKCKWYTFFPEIIQSIVSVVIVSLIGLFFKTYIPNSSWLYLIIFSALTALLGLALNFMIVLNKNERIFLLNRIKGECQMIYENLKSKK